MNGRLQIERKIESKRQEIAELDNKLRESQAFLQGLQEALKVISRDSSEGEISLREGSNVAKARDVIKRAGKPLHVKDILKAIGKDNSRNNRSSLSASISSYVKKGDIFTKAGAYTFGLVEFDRSPKVGDDEDLPENFGLDNGGKEGQSPL